jgi:lysophospholipid acyltransferase (LPLAT)-like uncharacterized protein
MSKSKLLTIKNISKKILKNNYLRIFGCFLIYFLLRVLFTTYRLKTCYASTMKNSIKQTKGIFYFWHQSIISGMLFFYKNKSLGYCIVSPSDDGKIAGFICKKLGFSVLYGSSNKSPIKLIKSTFRILETHGQICLVGDGSRGPAFQIQKGVLRIAERAKLPIIFIECKPRWAITFRKSWDKFQIPIPFSRIDIIVHGPQWPKK